MLKMVWKYVLGPKSHCQFDVVADFIQSKLSFIQKFQKRKSSLFEPPFGRLNVRISSIARWKARVRLPIPHN